MKHDIFKVTKEELIKKANSMCNERDCKLLYLAYTGSYLFGAATPNSDIDVSGIFLPSKKQMLIDKKTTYIKYKSESDEKSYWKDRFEITLFSLQFFLSLLKKNDINSIDLLHSYMSPSKILQVNTLSSRGILSVATENHKIQGYGYFGYNVMQDIVNNRYNLIELPNKIEDVSYVKFAKNQSIKYGVKGNRLGLAKEVDEFLNNLKTKIMADNINPKLYFKSVKIKDHLDDLFSNIGNNEFMKIIPGNPPYLELLNRKHMTTINLEEFHRRVKAIIKEYGRRTDSISNWVDWKSLSHSLRGIYQTEELYTTGNIIFPSKYHKLLRDIKLEKYAIKYVYYLIDEGLDRLKNISPSECVFKGKRDDIIADRIVLTAYNYIQFDEK